MTYHLPKQRRRVTIEFIDRIVGGTPTNPKLIEGWLKANMPDVSDEERAKLASTTVAEVGAVIEEASKGMWTTFKRDDSGIYIEARQVKAAIKEASNILRETFIAQERAMKKGRGELKESKSRFTALKSKVAERVFVAERAIYLLDASTGEKLQKPSGTEERAIHVTTAQGPRNALKKFDYADNCIAVFTVEWLDDGVFGDDILEPMLQYMGDNGLGADRSQSEGTFRVRSIEKV